MSREYTDEDMENMGASVYLSIKEGETLKCVTLSGIIMYDRGDVDMAGRIFDGGRFNKETEEQIKVFDLDKDKERILNVPLYLRIEMFRFLQNNELRVSDLKSGKMLVEIHRHDGKDWDIKLIDDNYELNQGSQLKQKSEMRTVNKEDLKFSIFKVISGNDDGVTDKEIFNGLGGNVDIGLIQTALEDLVFKDRKIKKIENNGKELYLTR